ncbi:MAG TPA: diacylglycerol kinase family protein [Hyphomonadaceae bacterium]|nr:diacylglycerol kinase family protein [Hyphomonadaceae bacterium]
MFHLSTRAKSFADAFNGLGFVARTQANFRIHAFIALLVTGAGLGLHVSSDAWRWLILAMALVLIAEVFNTAFEHLCDVVQPDLHASVKAAKDIAAGAVLLSAIAAAGVGALVFWPYVAGWR